MVSTSFLATLLGVPLLIPIASGVSSGTSLAAHAAHSQLLAPRSPGGAAVLAKTMSSVAKSEQKPQSMSHKVGPPPPPPPKPPKITPEKKKQAKHVAMIGGRLMCVGGDILEAIPLDSVQAAGKAVGAACGGADGAIGAHQQLKKGETPKIGTHRRRKRSVLVRRGVLNV